MNKIFLIIFICLIFTPAKSYLGPGIGAGILTATLGFVVVILITIFGLVWFPIKKLLKRKKENKLNKKVD